VGDAGDRVTHERIKTLNDVSLTDALRVGSAERKSQLYAPPTLLNEGQAAAFFNVGRRKFHEMRQQPWFTAVCTAVELGPRALRWHRDELLAAAKNAPRVTKLAEPANLAASRAGKASQ
jgi:hypothetical protein